VANDSTTTTPLAGDGGQPPAGDNQAPAATPDTPAVTETISLDEAKKLRSEAAGLRKRLKELEDAKKATDDAKLDETEKAKKAVTEAAGRLEATEAALRTERIGREVERTAAKLSLDPELAGRLVTADMLEFGEDGKPTNVEKTLKGLIQKWPNLVKSQAQPANINANDGRGSAQPDPKAREADLRRRFRI
jgi:hypothetical protein